MHGVYVHCVQSSMHSLLWACKPCKVEYTHSVWCACIQWTVRVYTVYGVNVHILHYTVMYTHCLDADSVYTELCKRVCGPQVTDGESQSTAHCNTQTPAWASKS